MRASFLFIGTVAFILTFLSAESVATPTSAAVKVSSKTQPLPNGEFQGNSNVKRSLRTNFKTEGTSTKKLTDEEERDFIILSDNRRVHNIIRWIKAKLYTLTPAKIIKIFKLRELPRRQYSLHMEFVRFVQRKCAAGLRWGRCSKRPFNSLT